jgi:hypothetical protein
MKEHRICVQKALGTNFDINRVFNKSEELDSFDLNFFLIKVAYLLKIDIPFQSIKTNT